MGRIVIAAYRPKPGQHRVLEQLMRTHYTRLRAEGLVTDRSPTLMRASDGTVVEVFEWQSADAIAAAHSNRAVLAMWGEYDAVSDYVSLAELPEGQSLFAEFEPMEPNGELHPEFSP
jgi:hypothetical protein